MAENQINRVKFWTTVVTSVAALTVVFTAYQTYEVKERKTVTRLENQLDRKVAQLDIQRQIVEEDLSNAYLAQNLSSIPSSNSNAVESQTNESNQLAVQVQETPKSSTEPVESQVLMASILNEADQVSLAPEVAVEIESKREHADLDQISRTSFVPEAMTLMSHNSTEFEKKPFCHSLSAFAGVSAGFDNWQEYRDFTPIVDTHVSRMSYNIENAEMISFRETAKSQFNMSVYGGVRLFERLDIEGGLTYHQFDQSFTSVYRNLYREEFTYVEWVATNDGSGPNGQPVYEPVEKLDFFYAENMDTITSSATYTAVEMPLVLRYNLSWNKFSVFASAGASAMLYSKLEVHSENKGTGESYLTEESETGMNQVYGILGGGVAYQILPHIELKFEPVFRPILYSKDKEKTYNSNFNSLNAGLTYRF